MLYHLFRNHYSRSGYLFSIFILFIYNINHIDISTFYNLFRDYNPRSGVTIKKEDLYGKRYGFITVGDEINLDLYNGMYIDGNKVYFIISKRKKNIIKNIVILKRDNKCKNK